jgi:monofunctional biosynthetic peptidoglycan transglycosylase
MSRRKTVRKLVRAATVATAVAFGYAIYLYLTLPDVRPLATTNPETTAFMELRAREARSRGEQPRRVQRWVTYSRISPHLSKAVLVAEDGKFWQHDGVDFEQLRESMEVNIERMEFARGASTITQQLAKNLYLSPTKNPIRKVRELLIARRLEAGLTKQRILELYLNVIEWGEGIYGAEAAARSHFGKSAAELGPSEGALLAAALVNPRILNPSRPSARLRRRQQMILGRMGAVVPPPAVAEAGQGPTASPAEPAVPSAVEPVPPLPEPGPPQVLPGEPVPAGAPSQAKPCEKPPCR